MAKSLTNFYMADFETNNSETDCRVWAWASCSLKNTNKVTLGNSIESFKLFYESIKNPTIFFHNLKFDSDFIINNLLHEGYTVVKEKMYLTPKSFTSTVSAQGQFYTVNIMTETGNKVTLFDSLKKLPFKVASIAKAFRFKIAKGEIDYDAIRPIDYHMTPEEEEYIKIDIKIVAEALKIQYEEGMESITVSKDCLNDYITTVGGENAFRNLFPALSLELFQDLKLAYRGGWVYVKEVIQGQIVGKGQTFDYNSMYPGVMETEQLPFGLPISFTGEYEKDKRYPLYIQQIICEFELKKDHLPTIQVKNNPLFKQTEYAKSSKGDRVILYLTNVDLEQFLEHYDVWNIEYINGWKFRSRKGMFEKYIMKHAFTKMNTKGALRELAKLKLNGLYGKFGTDMDVTGKLPFLKSDGSTGWRKKSYVQVEDETGKKRWKEDPDLKEYQEGVYIPVAIFVTAYARAKIIGASQEIYDRFCYADTDSIHMTGLDVPESLEKHIHPKDFGFLKRESQFARAKFVRPKTYIEDECVCYKYTENGDILTDEYGDEQYEHVDYGKHNGILMNVKCAGLDDRSKKYVTYENFYIGSNIEVPDDGKKLRPKKVKGGTVLTKIDISIREGFRR